MESWELLTEATIDAIHLEQTKKEIRIDVTCRWNGEQHKQIIAKGVDDFVVSEMRLSNIIDCVSHFDAGGGEEDQTARRLFFLIRGHEPSASDLKWPVLLEKLGRIRDGTLSFMELEPVYGATIILLAESIQLQPLGE
ncbi:MULTISPECIES: hypothetical protein [unclassified Pseudomonas]|uniref:hypothetical protein n=1 Tax=unclassified Pseudomonas TaxID=196821 RepID=UPI00087153AA|nr:MULTISPECIES: hypothetical protein [unclassified Pseudomonas]SCW97195.1 hypothetical protein SAMN03159424_05587 [Pseudomonas sp. NFACC05-1]SFL46790.1 hypothetical protein SAMN03159307_02685 [Pseudomonas sp. NFACC46-3]